MKQAAEKNKNGRETAETRKETERDRERYIEQVFLS